MSSSSIVAKAIAALLILGGCVLAVYNFKWTPVKDSTEATSPAASAGETIITARKAPPLHKPAEAASSNLREKGSDEEDSTGTDGLSAERESNRRVAALADDPVSTQPQLVIKDGETSGRIYFNILVVNESGLPVPGATVEMTGLRTRVESGSWYGWGNPQVKELTNDEGIARVSAPQFTTEQLETGAVTFNVTHPDYAPTDKDMHLDKITKVVLRTGWKLDVIATDEGSSEPLKSGISIDFNSSFKPDWSQQKNGKITIRNISDKELKFYVTQESQAKGKLLSDMQSIYLPRPAKLQPVYVTLHSSYDVNGRLSDNVPRPVANGKVSAFHSSQDHNCGIYARQEVDIAPDGTFHFKNMPKGEIQIYALADGWSSVLPDKGLKSLLPASRSQGAPQKFMLTEPGQEYVLPMNPTATAIFHLVDPQGAPVGGAIVGTNPNMCYENCCGMWIRTNEFHTTSTADGIAAIADIPPLERTRFAVFGPYELPPRPQRLDTSYLDRSVEYDLVPGQVLEQTLTVYPKGSTVITQDGDQMTSGTNE